MQLKKGFTLVEVLIALAILGIVAAATIYVLINAIPKEATVSKLFSKMTEFILTKLSKAEKNSAITMSKYSAISALLTVNNPLKSLITNSTQGINCLITSML